jgi:hypothetical protein
MGTTAVEQDTPYFVELRVNVFYRGDIFEKSCRRVFREAS